MNQSSGAKGDRGLLALRDADGAAVPKGGPAWRRKKRISASRVTGEASALEALKEATGNKGPAFRLAGENAASRMKNESGYKASGPPPRFGARAPKNSKD